MLFKIFVELGDEASSEQDKTLGVPGMLTNKGRQLEPGEGYGRDEDMHLTDATGFEEVTEGEKCRSRGQDIIDEEDTLALELV